MSIYKKLLDLQNKMSAVVKNKKGQYKYADITQILKELMPLLKEQNLLLLQELAGDGGTLTLITHIIDPETPDSSIRHSVSFNVQGCSMQQLGSVRTYLSRYALITMFVVPVVDDDGALAEYNSKTLDDPLVAEAEKFERIVMEDQTEAYRLWKSKTQAQKKPLWALLGEHTQKFMKSEEWASLADTGGDNGTAE